MKNWSYILQEGIRLLLKEKKFIILFWCTNFVFAILMSLPVYYLLNNNLENSAMSSKLTFGFDYLWYIQFSRLYEVSLGEIPYLIYGIVGLYVLIQIFYLGGLLAVLNIPKKNHYVDFFYGGVKYWFRFTKILLISLFFYALAFYINDLLGELLTYIFKNQEQRIAEFILRASRYILLIFLIGLVSLTSDYCKVCITLKDNKRILPEIKATLFFLKRNFNRIFIVFFSVAVMGAAGAIVYNVLNNYLPKSSYVYFLLAFILQQFLIIFRLFVRMLFSSTEIILFKDLNAEIIPAKAEEIV